MSSLLAVTDLVAIKDVESECNGKKGRVIGIEEDDRVTVKIKAAEGSQLRIVVDASNLRKIDPNSSESVLCERARRVVGAVGKKDGILEKKCGELWQVLSQRSADDLNVKEIEEILRIVTPGIRDVAARTAAMFAVTGGIAIQRTVQVGAALTPDPAFADAVLARMEIELDRHQGDVDHATKVIFHLWIGVEACLTVSKAERKTRLDQIGRLCRKMDRVAQTHPQVQELREAARFIDEIWRTLDDVPILVIEPSTRRGITASISGCCSMRVLNVLLMDVFPRTFGEAPVVSSSAVAIAQGLDGAPQDDPNEMVHANYSLYSAAGLEADGRLRQPRSLPNCDPFCPCHNRASPLISNFGVPADIPVVNGYHVILLGPLLKPYQWPAARTFACMKAAIDNVVVLVEDDLDKWLMKLSNLRNVVAALVPPPAA